MKVGDVCRRGVVSISSDMDVAAAAALMRERHVGFLVVYRRDDDIRHPIGVVTDRDIVLEVIAAKIEPSSVTPAKNASAPGPRCRFASPNSRASVSRPRGDDDAAATANAAPARAAARSDRGMGIVRGYARSGREGGAG